MKLLIIVFIIFLSNISLAHRGQLAADGCHYCRSNCEKKGYKKNTRHSHDGRKCTKSKKKKNTSYNRKAFKHWVDEDKDCQNTRHEVLERRSLIPVKFKITQSKKCQVLEGKWEDFYYNEVHTKAAEIDIDHIVPLKEAWDSGAQAWPADKKMKFANDEENLAITNKKYNRQKGSQTPLTWSPIDRVYNCKYLRKWIAIKKKYSLLISPQIYEYYQLASCAQTKIETH